MVIDRARSNSPLAGVTVIAARRCASSPQPAGAAHRRSSDHTAANRRIADQI
jgi:hypothetical protein